MKSERITFLGTSELKADLEHQAAKLRISVSELIRRRFQSEPSDEEVLLAALSKELTQGVTDARRSLRDGIAAVDEALRDISRNRSDGRAPLEA